MTQSNAAARFKAQLKAKGKTQAQWAKEHGFSRAAVARVLNGQSKGHFGAAHHVAVAAGLKPDVAS